MDRQTISDVTGFDGGGKFQNSDEVRYYFRREQLASCLDDPQAIEALPTQDELDHMANEVLANGWHCQFVFNRD